LIIEPPQIIKVWDSEQKEEEIESGTEWDACDYPDTVWVEGRIAGNAKLRFEYLGYYFGAETPVPPQPEIQFTVLEGCDCTRGGEWEDMQIGSVNDECGNTLTLTFNNNVYCYYYNGLKVGNCPYLGGLNIIGYWKTTNGKRFYATYHKSMDDTNDGSKWDEGTKYKYDSVIWFYDCISGALSKTPIEHPTIRGGDDGTGGNFEEVSCP
jgi:hypothetical protein